MSGRRKSKYQQPGFRVWSNDYLIFAARTQESTLTAGARFLLWVHSSKQNPPGTLPNDPEQLRQWAKLTPKQWASTWPRLQESWKYDRRWKRWRVERIAADSRYRRDISARRSKTGADVWRRRNNGDGKEIDARAETDAEQLGSKPEGGARSRSRPRSRSPSRSRTRPRSRSPGSPTGEPPAAGFFASLSPAQKTGWGALTQRVEARFPTEQLDRLKGAILAYVATGPPYEVLAQALQDVLHAKDVQNPAGLFCHIVKIHEPNYYEQRHIEEHERRKQEECDDGCET